MDQEGWGQQGWLVAFAFSQLKTEPTFSVVSKTEFNGGNTFSLGLPAAKITNEYLRSLSALGQGQVVLVDHENALF